jgi:hypothetical protein
MVWEKMTKPKCQGGIGFRDMRIFNQALLAKQAWRLLEFLDKLCARLLESKYFPSGDLIDTVFSQNASPCWQGIAHGLELLKHGIVWRINTGTKVKIWRDNWLPRGNHKAIGKASKSRFKWVSDLIDFGTKQWKEETVRSLFHPPDAEEILKIRIPLVNGEDFIAWAHEKNSLFSVKSAYRLGVQIQEKEKQASTSSEPDGERGLWKSIWNAKVPTKIKVFGWKLATNTLGVQVHRYRRNMDVIPTCSICGMEPETSHHAMVTCTKAKALRDCLRNEWDLPKEQMFRDMGQDWVLMIRNQCSEEVRSKLLFMWWRSWHMRNNMIFGDGKCTVKQSAQIIQSYLTSFMQANYSNEEPGIKGKKPVALQGARHPTKCDKKVETWHRPDDGWNKLNVDASFIKDKIKERGEPFCKTVLAK